MRIVRLKLLQQMGLISRATSGRSTASAAAVTAASSPCRTTGRATAALNANRVTPCIIITVIAAITGRRTGKYCPYQCSETVCACMSCCSGGKIISRTAVDIAIRFVLEGINIGTCCVSFSNICIFIAANYIDRIIPSPTIKIQIGIIELVPSKIVRVITIAIAVSKAQTISKPKP